jgi:hypothetical protein
VPAANYTFNDGVKDWIIPIAADLTIAAYDSTTIQVTASTVGSDADLAPGVVNNGDVSPTPPVDLVITVLSVTQGTDPVPSPTAPSKFFDMALALAYLVKLNIKMSLCLSLVKVTLPVQDPDTNNCWIRSKNSVAQQMEGLGGSVVDGDRAKYFYGALRLMECVNTWFLVHSEPVNVFVEILAAWFGGKNPSGTYIGNKLSLLRLSGTRIKPFGYPSWLDNEVNENDAAAFDGFDAMYVSYLATISDNSKEDCYVSAARGITGFPVGAFMIAKWIDYTSRNDTANFLTDKGTRSSPKLNNAKTYKDVQGIVSNNLSKMVGTERLASFALAFPDFSVAKTGLTKIEAASAWSGTYEDDLDTVTITGGITEQV